MSWVPFWEWQEEQQEQLELPLFEDLPIAEEGKEETKTPSVIIIDNW